MGSMRMYVDLAQFADLKCHASLIDLELSDWQTYSSVQDSLPTLLPHLKKLRVKGRGAEDESVGFLTMKCPALEALELHCTYRGGPRIYENLHHHPSSLLSLTLTVENGYADTSEFSKLARCTDLRCIKLGNGCYPRDIHSTLLLLPQLVEIDLGQGKIDTVGFESLVSGPSRLPLLKTITFDADFGSIGKKISAPSTKGFDATRELERCPVEMIDWRLPEQGEDVTFEAAGLKRLIEVAKENGVTVKGGVLTALQMVDDFHLESHNRAILFTYSHTLDHLRKARLDAVRDRVALPPLDLDSLDIDRLEIVEIDLPEQDWYMLSLRNKE